MKYLILLSLLFTSCKDGVIKEIPFVFEDPAKFEIDPTPMLR